MPDTKITKLFNNPAPEFKSTTNKTSVTIATVKEIVSTLHKAQFITMGWCGQGGGRKYRGELVPSCLIRCEL